MGDQCQEEMVLLLLTEVFRGAEVLSLQGCVRAICWTACLVAVAVFHMSESRIAVTQRDTP